MRGKKILTYVFVLAVLLSPAIAFAKGSSVDEIVHFINDLVGGCPEMNYVFSDDGESWDSTIKMSLNITGNLIILNKEEYGILRQHREKKYERKKSSASWEARANLSELSPSVSIEHDNKFSVVILSCSTRNCWKVIYYNFNETGNSMDNESEGATTDKQSYIYTCGKNSAEKLAKAFTHLLKLQGAKKSLP